MKSDRLVLRDITTIFFLFTFFGLVVGIVSGLTSILRNEYIDLRMFEILFWTLAGSVNHHLKFFLILAVINILIIFIPRLFGISQANSINFISFPLTTICILYFYGLPYWPIISTMPGKLLGKIDVLILTIILVLLVVFVILWILGLRKFAQVSLGNKLGRFFTRLSTITIVCLLPVGINLLDFVRWSKPEPPFRNLIMISLDTLRADHLGCYGYKTETSPNIDAFASEGVLFNRAISQSSWTLPAHASLFTGVYPSVHGAVSKKRSLPLSFLTLAEILRNEGYVTAAFTGGGYLNPIFGFKQGFMEYRHLHSVDSDEVLNYLEEHEKEPCFLFLHTYKIHNYHVPDDMKDMVQSEFAGEFKDLESIMSFVDQHLFLDLDDESWKRMEYLHRRYDISILHIDKQFGSLMDGLKDRGLAERTLVVLMSDHGEEFGEHGRTYHGGTLYNEQVHVPLIMKLPGVIPDGLIVNDIVELMDTFPTVLEYLGIEAPENIDGRSLALSIEGWDKTLDGLAFSEISSQITEKYSVLDTSLKLIYSPTIENLPLPGDGRLDIWELTWGVGWKESPLVSEENELLGPFDEWYERMKRYREMIPPGSEVTIDPALRDELRALGYVQ
jgi:hypothetical protein